MSRPALDGGATSQRVSCRVRRPASAVAEESRVGRGCPTSPYHPGCGGADRAWVGARFTSPTLGSRLLGKEEGPPWRAPLLRLVAPDPRPPESTPLAPAGSVAAGTSGPAILISCSRSWAPCGAEARLFVAWPLRSAWASVRLGLETLGDVRRRQVSLLGQVKTDAREVRTHAAQRLMHLPHAADQPSCGPLPSDLIMSATSDSFPPYGSIQGNGLSQTKLSQAVSPPDAPVCCPMCPMTCARRTGFGSSQARASNGDTPRQKQ